MTRRAFHHEPEEVRRQALIDATLEAVAESGLAGATVREVAKRASVTPGLIRRYFQSKDRLVQAAYMHFVEDSTARIAHQIGEGPALDRLERFVRANFADGVAGTRYIAIWSAFVAVANVDPAMARIHAHGYLAFRLLLEEILADLFREAQMSLSADAIREKAFVANAIIDGIWLELSLAKEAFADIDPVEMAIGSICTVLSIDRSPNPKH